MFEKLHSKNHYEKLFNSWEASEQIIDENHTIWRLQSPESKSQFIAMYRDRARLFIYGEYDNLIFDRMTWIPDIHNLRYDDLGYQIKKLSADCLDSVRIYDDTQCQKDILKWLNEQTNHMVIDDYLRDYIEEFLENTSTNDFTFFIDETTEELSEKFEESDPVRYQNCIEQLDELRTIIEFAKELTENTDEYEWISFLRRNTDRIEEFEDPASSKLWNAGKCIHQKFYVNMFAMYILSEKLKNKPERKI